MGENGNKFSVYGRSLCMKITGTVGVLNTIPNRFSKEGQEVLVAVGFKVAGLALDFGRYGLSLPDGATSGVNCECFITFDKAKEILTHNGRINGLILDNGMQLSRNTHLYDYPLYLTELSKTVSVDEYKNLLASTDNDLMKAGYFTAFASPDGNANLYSIPVESNKRYSMTLVAQIVERDKATGYDSVTGYQVAIGDSKVKVPMTNEAIAKNSDMMEPVNFIVKKTGKKISFSAKAGSSLKDLPVINFGVKAKVGKVSENKELNVNDVSLSTVCNVMKAYDVDWLKFTGKKGEYKEKIEEQEFDLLGIDIASPEIRYSLTSLNANFTFKKLATTRVEYDDNGYMFKLVNCYTFATRSLYDTKGAKGLDKVYMLCPSEKVALFTFEIKNKLGIDLKVMSKGQSTSALAYINSGILKYDNYVILEGDFSIINITSKEERDWAKGCNPRLMHENMLVLKGERTYLKKHRDSLKQAIEAMKDYTGVSLPESPVCKAYKDYDAKLLEAMKSVGLDISTGTFTPKQEYAAGYKEAIKYSIPKVTGITSKDFSKTLAEAKEKILNDKNPLKKKVYTPMFKYLENYVNASNNSNTELDKLEFAEEVLKSIGDKIDEFTKVFWYYNQFCVSGVETGNDMFIYDNGSPDLVDVVGDKVECKIPGDSSMHNTYMVTIDLSKVHYANAEQRASAKQTDKFKGSCMYSALA